MASDGRNPPYIDALHIIYAVAPTATQARTIRTVVCALLQSCWQRPLESLVLCSDVLEHPSPHSSGRWLKPMLAPLSSFLPGSHFTISRGSSGPLRHRDCGCPHTGRCPHLHPPSYLWGSCSDITNAVKGLCAAHVFVQIICFHFFNLSLLVCPRVHVLPFFCDFF